MGEDALAITHTFGEIIMGQLDGKVAFITGAGRGQGRSHAVRLAEEGADIIAVDCCVDIAEVGYPMASEADLAETERLVNELDRRIVAVKADVREIGQLRAAVERGVAELGHIDVVSANAGISTMSLEPTDDVLSDCWDATLEVNCKGVWNTVRACAPGMMERNQGGSIILTSSTAGLKGFGSPGMLGSESYAASKFGVVGLMKCFAQSLAPYMIRVNTIHPCPVDTMMINNDQMTAFLTSFPDLGASLSNLMPIATLAPRDISDAVLFLASDASRYITGVQLPVDAGFNAK